MVSSSSTMSTRHGPPSPMTRFVRPPRRRDLRHADRPRDSRVASRDGQHDAERRAASGRAFHGDRSAVRLDDAVAHAEAEPGAFASGLRREERLEHALQRLLRHAGAGVGHLGDDRVALASGPDHEPLRRRAPHRVLGVDDEVENHLLQLLIIAGELGQRSGRGAFRPRRPTTANCRLAGAASAGRAR